MKSILFVFMISLITFPLLAQEELVIPDGIKYIKSSSEVNQRAKEKLEKLFSNKSSNEEVLTLFSHNPLFCGPVLWEKMKSDPNVARITSGVAHIDMPVIKDKKELIGTQKKEGKVFQSPDEVLAFWKAFTAKTNLINYKIRKLNPFELKIYWAMIPFDITEPIFMVESDEFKILTAFVSPDDLRIMWIDDYQGLY